MCVMNHHVQMTVPLLQQKLSFDKLETPSADTYVILLTSTVLYPTLYKNQQWLNPKNVKFTCTTFFKHSLLFFFVQLRHLAVAGAHFILTNRVSGNICSILKIRM